MVHNLDKPHHLIYHQSIQEDFLYIFYREYAVMDHLLAHQISVRNEVLQVRHQAPNVLQYLDSDMVEDRLHQVLILMLDQPFEESVEKEVDRRVISMGLY